MKPKKKKKKSKLKEYVEDEDMGQLPPVIVKGGKRRPEASFLQSEGLRSPTDSPEANNRTSLIRSMSPRTFSPDSNTGEDQRLLDQMFGHTSEPEIKSVKKRKKSSLR